MGESSSASAAVVEWLRELGCPRSGAEISGAARRLTAAGGGPTSGAATGPAVRYLASAVCGPERVQLVRRNLAVSSATAADRAGLDGSGPAPGERRAALEAEVVRERAEVAELREALAAEARELAQEESTIRDASASCSDSATSAALVQSAGSKWAGMAQDLASRSDDIAEEIDAARRALARDPASPCPEAEAAIAALEAHLVKLHTEEGSTPSGDLDRLHVPRAQAEAIASVLMASGAPAVLAGAQAAADSAIRALAESTQASTGGSEIQHAEGRQFNVETSKGVSASERPRALLKKEQQRHFEGFLATEEALNAAAAARQALQDRLATITNPAEVERVRELGRAAGLQACAELLEAHMERLLRQAEGIYSAVTDLRRQWDLIQSFNARDEALEQTIAAARRYCLTSGKRLLLDCGKVRETIAPEVIKCATALKNSVELADRMMETELADFQGVNLRCIPALESATPGAHPTLRGAECLEKEPQLALQRMEKAFMELHQTAAHGQSDPLGSVLHALSGTRPAAGLLAPEALLTYNLASLYSVLDTLDALSLATAGAAEAANTAEGFKQDVTRLQELNSAQQKAMEALAERVDVEVEGGKEGISAAGVAQGLVDTWWRQPALDATPWVAVGMETGMVRIRPLRDAAAGAEELGEKEVQLRSGERTAREWHSYVGSLAAQLATST